MNTPSFVANSLSERKRYKTSGAISPPSFLFWTMLAFAVAVVLATGMFALRLAGHYYILLVAAIAGLAVGGMARLAMAKGHCRNPLIALLTGLLLSVVLYLGSYYVGMIYHLGPESAAHPELFVEYLRLRLTTDVVRSTRSYGDDSKRGRASYGFNLFRFGLEFVMVTAIVTTAAYKRSRKPYCENCHRWLARETTSFTPDKGPEIIDCLQQGSPRALAAICAAPVYTSIPNTTMAVEYCPALKEGTARDCPAFLSLKSVDANPSGITVDNFEQSKGKMLAALVQLNHDEYAALAPRFPVFETHAGRAAVAALLPHTDAAAEPEEARPPESFVEITPLPSEHSGKVLTRKAVWLGNLFAFAMIGGFIGGLALLAWGAAILEDPRKSVFPESVGVGICVLGGLCVLTALAAILIDPAFGANRRLRRAFNAELARRSGKLVEPDDPAAIFVEIVPKLNWGKVMLENASDIGLLLVDKRRKELRFEGDRERWRVSADGILSYGLEFYIQGQGAGATKIYYAVVRAARRDGFWEAPLRERSRLGALTAKRKKRAMNLLNAIAEIAGQDKEDNEWLRK